MENEYNEEVVLEEEVEETQEETPAEEPTKPERREESLEDRRARLQRQLDQTEKKLGVNVKKPETKTSKKSDDFGYDVKSYLIANGIKKDEFDFVKDALNVSGKDVDSLLDSKYFQEELEEHRALSATKNATPTGKRSGSVPADSIEYWMAKDISEVPQDMRAKVVNAKMAKENNKGVFYNS